MNTVKTIGHYLDQPILVTKFAQKIPALLSCTAGGIVAYDVYNTPQKKRKKRLIQNGLTMFGAVSSSLLAGRITGRLFHTAPKIVNLKTLREANSSYIDSFCSKYKINEQNKKILDKAKSKILSINEIKTIYKNFQTKEEKELLSKLIPEPENITSKEIFSGIGRLSVFGLIPVLGGVFGGILGDRLTCSNYKERIPNKVKEGAYQYLANIFLCNIGAGTALGILEKMNVKSKSARALGMVSGIILTGIIGGSAIANLIGRKVINKCFKNGNTSEKDRKPEPLDICLHSDDIATVAVMSGLKWIEPCLPALYSISGYRAGIGYRGKEQKAKHPSASLKTPV